MSRPKGGDFFFYKITFCEKKVKNSLLFFLKSPKAGEIFGVFSKSKIRKKAPQAKNLNNWKKVY